MTRWIVRPLARWRRRLEPPIAAFLAAGDELRGLRLTRVELRVLVGLLERLRGQRRGARPRARRRRERQGELFAAPTLGAGGDDAGHGATVAH